MIVAVALVVLAGYIAVRGLLDEKEALPALGLGTALGWSAFITVLNLALRAGIAFSVAAPVALASVIALGVAGAFRIARRSRGRATLDPGDLALILVSAFPASALILLYQFLGTDGDYYIHYPLIAFFLKGYFPHFHPYFPSLALHGHYGRDLGLAGLLSFGPIGIGTATILEAWILHLATLVNVYVLAKRAGAGRLGGGAAAFLVFFGVNAGFADLLVRTGLAEVMGNNNPVVYAFLFAILRLVPRLLESPTWPAVILLGLLLGGFDIVYEAYFHVLAAALMLLLVLLVFGRLRPASPAVPRRLAAALAISVAVMLPAGGLTSHTLVGLLPSTASKPATRYDFFTQTVRVSVPKRPLLSLTHAGDGRPVPLFSAEFARGQGLGVWLLPASVAILGLSGSAIGLTTSAMAVIALVVPATVDFGAYNGENFRYIFLAGVMSAVSLPVAAGVALHRLAPFLPTAAAVRWLGLAGLVLVLARTSAGSYERYRGVEALALAAPEVLKITERHRLEEWCAEYGPADEAATAFLARRGRRGDRLATNYFAPYQRSVDELISNTFVIMSSAQMPVVGFNARITRQTGGIATSVHGWSGQAIAFWATGDEHILRDVGANWLYVVPRWLPADVARRLAESRALREAFRSGGRVVYQVESERLPRRPELPLATAERLTAVRVSELSAGRPEEFRRVAFTLQYAGDAPLDATAFVFYRIYDRVASAAYDRTDEVGTVHHLALAAGTEMRLTVPFVVPYSEGEYTVEFFVAATGGDVKLGTFPLRVGSPS